MAGAYEVLSDSEQRAIYDRYGEEGLQQGGQPRQHRDAFDIFQNFFRGGSGQFHRHQRVQRGPDTETTIECNLQDAYRGVTIDITLELQGICEECEGSGSEDGQQHKCPDCDGAGVRIMRQQLAPGMIQQIQIPCERCRTTGQINANPCKACGGTKVARERRAYSIPVEPGAPREWDYNLEGEADASPDWVSGNLIVHVKEARDKNLGYRRRGQDLMRTEVLSLKESINGGWTRNIRFLDGKENITLSRKAGSVVTNGEIQKIKGKGMPLASGGHGDLYIEYVVVGSALPLDKIATKKEL